MPPYLNPSPFLPLTQDRFQTPDFNPAAKRRPMLPKPPDSFPLAMSDAPQVDRRLPQLPARPMPQIQEQPQMPEAPQIMRPEMNSDPRGVPLPSLPGRGVQPTPYSFENQKRYEYVTEGMRNEDGTLGNKVKRNWGDIGRSAFSGFMDRGLFGAALGAAAGAIDPQGTRERNFNRYRLPQIQQDAASAQAEEARARAQEMARLNQERATVGLDQERAQTELYKAQAKKALNPEIKPRPVRLQPMVTEDGSTVLVDLDDPNNAGKQFKPFVRPERVSPTQQQAVSEMEREATEGTPENIADDSYAGRGGDAYVLSRLNPSIQEILQKGTFNGDPATPEEIESANRTYQNAIKQEKAAILQDTKATARQKSGRRTIGKRSGPASATGTRSLKDLESKYFGGR